MDQDIYMDVSTPPAQPLPEASSSHAPEVPSLQPDSNELNVLTQLDHLYQEMRSLVASVSQARDPFREIQVKVHIRRPEKDSWSYLGRGIVSQEGIPGMPGQSSRVVVRSATSHKILAVFGEGAPLQTEKRGNFVVIGCIEGNRVVSWSLNAINNSETLRLLASIDLACWSHKHTLNDPYNAHRRRIARIIKDDRRRRHKRRKDQDTMVAAFARTGLDSAPAEQSMNAEPS